MAQEGETTSRTQAARNRLLVPDSENEESEAARVLLVGAAAGSRPRRRHSLGAAAQPLSRQRCDYLRNTLEVASPLTGRTSEAFNKDHHLRWSIVAANPPEHPHRTDPILRLSHSQAAE